MARPKANINWDEVGKLLEAGCSGVGIAASIGVDEGTLRKRCEKDLKCSFSEFAQQKKAKGDDILRAKQFQLAAKGDRTLLIWLGKQRLGQSDKAEQQMNVSGEIATRLILPEGDDGDR